MIQIKNHAPSKQRTLLLDRMEQRTLFSAAAFVEPALADVDLGSVVEPFAAEQCQDCQQAESQPTPIATHKSAFEFSYHSPTADSPSAFEFNGHHPTADSTSSDTLPQLTPSKELTLEAAPGDFNRDGRIDAVDIDMLCHAMNNPSANNAFYATFDLNGDVQVNHGDVEMLVQDIIGTDFGDANLDGRIDDVDVKLVFSNMFSAASGWSSGDFTCDGIVDGQDFIVWNSNKFNPTPQAAAPAATEEARNMAGDFNGDGVINDLDIDLLCSAMQTKVATAEGDSAFDLNRDGLVSRADVNMLVHDIIGTEFGDTNLDGRVDGLDAATILNHVFTAASGWSSGDVTCDGVIDGQDFIVWNANKTTTPQLDTAAEGATDAVASVIPRQRLLDASGTGPSITTRVTPAFSYWRKIHNENDSHTDLWGKTRQDTTAIRKSETHTDREDDVI